MSSHPHRCIIHPQHNHVGVCALCLRERLVALAVAESESSNHVLSCSSSTASDGAFHSFSSSSAREHGALSPAPRPASADHHHRLKPPPAAASSSSSSSTSTFLHKLKLKALISIPPSPDRAISKHSAGLLYSPSARSLHPKSKPHPNGRNSSTSELAEAPLHHPHANVAPGYDRISAPSAPHVEGSKASLRSLFNQSTDIGDATQGTTEYSYSGFTDRAFEAPSDERRRRIEEFSAAMRSPGFAPSMSKAAPMGDCKQGYESAGEYNGSRPHASWIASLFQRKKQKSTMSRNAMATTEVNTVANSTFEASARGSVDFARVSMDSASTALNLKQMIRSRLQQEEANAMKNAAGTQMKHKRGRPPLAGDHHKVHINSKLEQPQPAGNMNTTYDFPARSSISIGSTISVAGTRISSTAQLGVEGDKPSDGHDSNALDQVRHFPRSRSWGRAWSRGQLPQSSMASPQHVLWGGSKQHTNNNHTTSNVKLSSVQHHFLTSTPKHPSMDAPAQRDSRVGFGFYLSPFRRSKVAMKSEGY